MAKRTELSSITGAETLIGAGVKVKGTLASDSDIVIDGKLTGEIKAVGSVTIGINAQINADVQASSVTVAGKLKGNIEASGETTIESTGKVTGNITTATLSIESGAIFIGKSSMAQQTAAHVDEMPKLTPQEEPTT